MRSRFWLVVASCALVACEDKPDPASLAAWRKEAQASNAKRLESAKDAGATFTLRIDGEVDEPRELTVADVRAAEAVKITRPKTDVYEAQTFRGPKLSTLIDRARPKPDAETATIIGKDGYFATVDLPDLRAYPFIMAYEIDGEAMTTATGGPISVRFDQTALTPDLHRRYEYAGVLYTTHIIVGNELPHLRVGSSDLRAAELDKLPEVSLTGVALYRTAWEPTPQTLWGVRLRDVIVASGAEVPRAVRVLGKDSLHQEEAATPRFTAAELDECQAMIVRRYGPTRKLVPTSMGGPLLLAINDHCRPKYGRKAWLAFAERVELIP